MLVSLQFFLIENTEVKNTAKMKRNEKNEEIK